MELHCTVCYWPSFLSVGYAKVEQQSITLGGMETAGLTSVSKTFVVIV